MPFVKERAVIMCEIMQRKDAQHNTEEQPFQYCKRTILCFAAY